MTRGCGCDSALGIDVEDGQLVGSSIIGHWTPHSANQRFHMGQVSRWKDLSDSGQDVIQADPDHMPKWVGDKWNAIGAVRFDGDQYLTLALPHAPTSDLTIYAMIAPDRVTMSPSPPVTASIVPTFFSIGTTNVDGFRLFLDATDNKWAPQFVLKTVGNTWGEDFLRPGPLTKRGEPQLISAVRSGATMTLEHYGATYESVNNSGPNDYGGAPFLIIGAGHPSSGTTPVDGYWGLIWDLLLIEGALDEETHELITEDYFAATYKHRLQDARFICSFNGADVGLVRYQSDVGFSPDGNHYATLTGDRIDDFSDPVMNDGYDGEWDSRFTKDPWIIEAPSVPGGPIDEFRTYYMGATLGTTDRQIGLQRSKDLIHWTRHPLNPLIRPDAPWKDSGVIFPVVVYDPGDTLKPWKMWFGGSDGTDYRMGFAWSLDGIVWTEASDPVVGVGPGAYDLHGVVPSGALKIGTTWNIIYNSLAHTDVTFPTLGSLSLVTVPVGSEHLSGSYTKHGGNPLLTRRAAASSLITADAICGDREISVSDATVFATGEAVYLFDPDGAVQGLYPGQNPELHRVAYRTDATHLVLEEAVRFAFLAADSCIARSVHFNNICPRSLRYDGEAQQYVAEASPYQAFQYTSTLRETAFRYVAPALTGPWRIDHANGQLIPSEDPGAWNQPSAENPRTIPLTIAGIGA